MAQRKTRRAPGKKRPRAEAGEASSEAHAKGATRSRPAKKLDPATKKPSAKAERKERERNAPTSFVASASNHRQLPEHGLPEFAFIGRSNVGKSSALNAILKRPGLVRVSRTPGRTQLLNLFRFEGKLALMDLPGYGFAKLSKKQRDELSVMIRDYLCERDGLLGVVVLLDARRDGPTDDDLSVIRWIQENERPVLPVLTKIDLIPKNRRIHRLRLFEKALGLEPGAVLAFSAETREGRPELLRSLLELAQCS